MQLSVYLKAVSGEENFCKMISVVILFWELILIPTELNENSFN